MIIIARLCEFVFCSCSSLIFLCFFCLCLCLWMFVELPCCYRVLEFLFNTWESSFLFLTPLKFSCVYCFYYWMFVQFQLPCSILENQYLVNFYCSWLLEWSLLLDYVHLCCLFVELPSCWGVYEFMLNTWE